MARIVTVEWSANALADLNRFAGFLHKYYPNLAEIVAGEIIAKAGALAEHPELGRPLAGRPEYRELILQVLNAIYVFQYRFDGERVTILRAFHGREKRD